MKNNNTNGLASAITWVYEVIAAADHPISLVIMVALPFISPLLPALITADSLQKYMQFDPSWSWIAVLSFEMIGYLGMISLVGAMIALSKNTDPNKVEALKWNRNFYLWAYGIYLLTLLASNVILEIENNVPLTQVLVILCLTVGLSVSAGILNASRIQDRDEKRDNYVIRQEKREDNLKTKALKAGINVFQQNVPMVLDSPQEAPRQIREKHASDYEDKIISMLATEYTKSGKVLSPSGICHTLKIDVNRNKGHVFRLTKRWKEKNGILTVSEKDT